MAFTYERSECAMRNFLDKLAYVSQAFQKMSYHLGLLKKLKNKALDNFEKGNEERKTVIGEYLVIQYAKEVQAITRVLSDAGMRIAYTSGQKLHD